ncbi:lipoate--protein ligase [Vallitalea maricola]|uniref:Lipoate--protein ligase n=1 Tax=Vallitalea maricola TaxID=3074433 RepID=A0ACB5UMW4_9FIRM|nr:lipoate--protein ligase [Vallitalea sp. AN17-2]
MPSNDINVKMICSNSTDPWYNLALEEYLLRGINENEIILYLWQNDNTVVIGRNQNPWKECKCKKLENEGGKLARRLSGGGAVYHDLGNLNFTFVMDKNLYDLDRQLNVILQAVRSFGIDAEFSGRNDLTVHGKKFSGNAFYFLDKSSYHHGTILIDTDFSKLTDYLQVSKEKISSKGIDSVRSRVINLSELNDSLTTENMKRYLIDSFENIYGKSSTVINVDNDTYNIQEIYDKYASWKWRFGEAPKFDITFDKRFSWGGFELGLNLKNGHIKEAKIYSDAMNSQLIQKMASCLLDVPFIMDRIIDAIGSISTDDADKLIIDDVTAWLIEKSKSI